ncbi:MAG: hypothetical protein P8X85_23665, partial [Desulfobacterales bacterium]
TPVNGQPRGYYEVTGETVAQDVHSITLRAVTADAITIDQVFTVTKSLAGLDASAKAVILSASSQSFAYDNSSGTPSLIGPNSISITANRPNIVGATTWQAWDHTGTEITPIEDILSGIADGGATMTATSFGGITNNDFIRVRATADGIYDEVTVVEILSGINGTIGNDAKIIAVGANSRTIYREAFEFGVPVEWFPTAIDFTANRQNISGDTTWRIYDSLGIELSAGSWLTDMTNTTATFTSSQIDSMTNNDFFRVTATADSLTDEITIVRQRSGVNGVVTYLTNETHLVEVENDGSGADLSGFSGTHVVYQGYSLRTTDATHSVVGTATSDGLTLQVGATTGIYSFTGTWGTAVDTYTWTLRASYAGNNYDRDLTLTKSRKALPGEASVVSYLTNPVHNVATASDGSGADLTGDQGGTHKVFDGLTDVTTTAVHQIVGGNDNGDNWTKLQNGMTLTINETTGDSDVSGTWTPDTDTETFTLVIALVASANAFSYDNTTGTPALIGPSDITLIVNEQNTTGSTTWEAWDDQGTAISPVSDLLSSITDAGATITATAFGGIVNNDWVRVRATRDGIYDEVTVYKLTSGQDGGDGQNGYNTATLLAYKRQAVTPTDNPGSLTYTFASAGWTPQNGWLKEIPTGTNPCWVVAATAYSQGATDNIDAAEWTNPPTKLVEDGTDGDNAVDPVIGVLTNEAHVVATLANGTGFSLTSAGGTFQVWQGVTDVTGSGPTYTVVGGATNGANHELTTDNLKMSINQTTGVYTLTDDGGWNEDDTSFTLRATYATVDVDRTYTISKSRTGSAGESAKSLRITSDGNIFLYTGFWSIVLPESIDFTAVQVGSTEQVSWRTQEWNGSDWVNTATNRMSPLTGLSSTLSRAGFEAENEDSLRVVAEFDDGGIWTDSQTIYKTRFGTDTAAVWLTNEAHTVTTAFDGSGYSFVDAGGTMKCYEGATDVTTDSLTTYSLPNGSGGGGTWTETKASGLIMTLNESTGVYSLSGTWASNDEIFTLRCTRRGSDYDRQYTIAKSKAGEAGAGAILISVEADSQNFRYDAAGDLVAPDTINFTANQQGSTGQVSWKTQKWVTNEWVDTATNRMTTLTGLTSSLSETNFDLEAETVLRVVAEFDEGVDTYTDSVTIVKVQDGATGGSGTPGLNVANIFLYQRTNTDSAPAKPATPTSATYTFSTGVLDPNPWDGWTQEVPAYSAGYRWLWVTTATAVSSTATDNIDGNECATVREMSYLPSDVTTGLLTNEAHVVTTDSDGNGYSYTNAGGTFKVWSGDSDVTGAGPVYSLPNGSDQGA